MALCLIPALATFCYLMTVTQIMGGWGRYYAPYFAFFVVPALLVMDSRIQFPAAQPAAIVPRRRALFLGGAVTIAACAVLVFGVDKVKAALTATDRAIEARPFLYDDVRYEMNGTAALPPQYRNVRNVAEFLVGQLPAGVSIAASEVGYIGVANPAATVIDLEGLNDTRIALQGFSVEDLIARRPDVIWMPHKDYTYQRGVLLSSPLLLRQYDLFVDVGGYGMAIRKNSPIYPLLLRQVQTFWNKFYPGYSLSDYVARSVSWSGQRYSATER